MSKAEEKQTMRDATDSFYEWMGGNTSFVYRPSPKDCYEAGYNNALAGIPNPEAVRELVEAALSYTKTVEGPSSKADLHRAKVRLDDAVHFLSAPSTGAQQK